MSVINTNLQAINAARTLDQNQEMLGQSLARLSSGSKIAKPSDDSAGLAVSAKLNAQSLRVQAALTNIQTSVSQLQTSDGYMDGMSQIVSRLAQLTTLAADPTKSATDIQDYQREFTSLQDQLRNTIGGTTAQIGGTTSVNSPLGSYNGTPLFGPNQPAQTITIGPDSGQTITLQPIDLTDPAGAMSRLITQDGSGNYTLTITSPTAASDLQATTQQLASSRASVGAYESRMNLASTSLQVESQNLTAEASRIQDVDVAQESTQLAKYNILVQAGTSMLAQANQSASSVLKLLG